MKIELLERVAWEFEYLADQCKQFALGKKIDADEFAPGGEFAKKAVRLLDEIKIAEDEIFEECGVDLFPDYPEENCSSDIRLSPLDELIPAGEALWGFAKMRDNKAWDIQGAAGQRIIDETRDENAPLSLSLFLSRGIAASGDENTETWNEEQWNGAVWGLVADCRACYQVILSRLYSLLDILEVRANCEEQVAKAKAETAKVKGNKKEWRKWNSRAKEVRKAAKMLEATRLFCAGWTDEDVAEKMGVSIRTVERLAEEARKSGVLAKRPPGRRKSVGKGNTIGGDGGEQEMDNEALRAWRDAQRNEE